MEVLINRQRDKKEKKGLLDQYLLLCQESHSPFLLFRYANQSIALASYSPSSKALFTFAPFDQGEKVILSSLSLLGSTEFQDFKPFPTAKSSHRNAPKSVGQEHFISIVNQAKEAIKADTFQKVVLSKTKKLTDSIDPIATFFNLEEKYQSAFVYCFYHPTSGLWIGATPEKLLEKDAKDQYHIHSLAGTKALDEKWSEKEKNEQKIVTDYIIQKLKTQDVKELTLEGPVDYEYGSIKHLKSSIHFHSELQGTALVKVIHPTPAVCGMPSDVAKDFILDHEGYDRSYYTGYLGLQGFGKMHDTYFVNLRCMQVIDDNTYIYTGAGIVADSDAEAEWNEVEAKALTLTECIKTYG